MATGACENVMDKLNQVPEYVQNFFLQKLSENIRYLS